LKITFQVVTKIAISKFESLPLSNFGKIMSSTEQRSEDTSYGKQIVYIFNPEVAAATTMIPNVFKRVKITSLESKLLAQLIL